MLASNLAQHVHVRLLLDPLLAVSLRHGDGRDSLDILHCADHHGVGLGEGAGGAVGFPGPVLVLGILYQSGSLVPDLEAGLSVPGLVLVFFLLFSVSFA